MSKKILVITSWSYNDALIQTYTLPYLDLISKKIPDDSIIFLVTLEKKKENHIITNPRVQLICIPYYPFGIKGVIMWIRLLFKLKILIKKEKINYVHAWCTPAGMIAYLLTFFSNKKLIIDSYEPHAESMVENGTWTKRSLAYKMLHFFEKKLVKRADFIIATTTGLVEQTVYKYKLDINKFFVKPACVDLNLFSIDNLKNEELIHELGLQDKITCVYAGKFGGIYLAQEVFDFIKVAEQFWGDQFRFLLLTNHSDEEIEMYRLKSEVSKKTIVKRFVQHSLIPYYIGVADFALTPVKPVPSKRFCTPIKDGEYWALGLPIVITRDISDDSGIIEKNDIGYVLKELSHVEYLNAIKKIENLLKENSRIEMYNIIRPIAERFRNYGIAEKIYTKIYLE